MLCCVSWWNSKIATRSSLWHGFSSVQIQNKKLLLPPFLHKTWTTTSRCACGLRKATPKLLPSATSHPFMGWWSSEESTSPAVVKSLCLTWRSGTLWELQPFLVLFDKTECTKKTEMVSSGVQDWWWNIQCGLELYNSGLSVWLFLCPLEPMWPREPTAGDDCHVWRLPSCVHAASPRARTKLL